MKFRSSLYRPGDDDSLRFALEQIELDLGGTSTGGSRIVKKATTETVNNSAVLQDDDELKLPVTAGAVVKVDLRLLLTAVGAGNIQIAFTVPSGTFYWTPSGAASATVITTGATTFTVGAGTTVLAEARGIYVGGATAGNLQLQWAQAIATAANSQVLANSLMTGTRA